MAGGGLGAWGQSQLQNAVAGFFGNPYLRDYTHAAKTFLPNSYENAPKLKFLFHTVFEINQEILPIDEANVNLSVLVKSVKLPSFNIETQQLNQYNRKRINQTKIKYDPIDITFHDDSGNVISSLWYRYYTYYFKDGQNPQVVFNGKRGATPNTTNAGGGVIAGATDAIYNDRTQYIPSTTGFANWGYTGQGTPSKPDVKIPFFKNITIFGINRHEFISYTLINPVITRFGHDTYAYESNNGVMENTMSIDYETVVYNQGAIQGGDKSDNIIKGFGDSTVYDKRLSPIATPGSNATIIGQGGLIDAAGGFVKDLGRGDLAGVLGAARTAGVTYNTFKNVNFKNLIQGEITRGLTNVLQGTSNPTRNTSWEIPVYGQTGSIPGTAGASTPGASIPPSIFDRLGTVFRPSTQTPPLTDSNGTRYYPVAGTQVPDPTISPPDP